MAHGLAYGRGRGVPAKPIWLDAYGPPTRNVKGVPLLFAICLDLPAPEKHLGTMDLNKVNIEKLPADVRKTFKKLQLLHAEKRYE